MPECIQLITEADLLCVRIRWCVTKMNEFSEILSFDLSTPDTTPPEIQILQGLLANLYIINNRLLESMERWWNGMQKEKQKN